MRSSIQSRVLVAIVIAAALCWGTPTLAQLARRGGELRVNESSIGRTSGSRVAATPGGGFIVTWDNDNGDGDGFDVFARRFDAEGIPASREFHVSASITGDQPQPRLAVTGDGSFMIVWNADPFGFGQAFSADGAPRGSEITFAEADVNGPANSIAATGNEFVVVLTDFIGTRYELRARHVAADGRLLGPSFAVSTPDPDTIPGQMFGSVAAGAGDSFLVAWYDERQAQMRARHFSATRPSGSEQVVGDVSNFSADAPAICGNDAGFVVAWEGDDTSPFENVIRYRRYNSNGEVTTDAVRVTPQREMLSVGSATVTCGNNRDFVVAWGEDYDVVGQADNERPATFRIREALRPSISMLTENDFVVTWDTCADNQSCDLFAQIFTLAGPTGCPGDCDRDGFVTVSEIVAAVNAALTTRPDLTRRCLPADTSLDYRVTVDELTAVVARLLQGC